ncbi:ATP-binding SpoIIE family protein phosphatase [Yinghuangia seranimata]|uniref:ATP-binding SpoIIE family protein phosphatase n=1 Tax=Yinghuangia seranimata TaxID=408067 RepID=UPI00248C2D61|nr:SpoIIE family protein phosphatase [Yinghuangia seranimata]MDI2132413.1 SpoIIE family protein phosphatase [Yinghuangia seranimata]
MHEQHRLVAGLGLPSEWAERLATTVFSQGSIGLVVFDADLRVIATNASAEVLQRAPVRVGDPADAALTALGLDDALPLLRQALAADAPLLDRQPLAARGQDGHTLYLRLAMLRVPPSGGQPLGLLVTFNDVTEQVHAEARAAIVHEAAAAIGASLDVTETTQQLADLLVPGWADLAAVDLATAVLAGEEPVRDPSTGYTAAIRTAVAATGDSWPPYLVQVGEEPLVPLDSPEARTIERGATLLLPQVVARPGDGPDILRRLIPVGGHSSLAVPLFARGHLLGAVQLWRTERPDPFDEDDARLLEEVASRAALSVDNARRYTREHRVALALQHSLLPDRRADEPAAETFGAYLPTATAAGVGGDWYDVIPLSSTRLALVVGDVVGHGLAASGTMGRLRTAVQALADMDLPPDELLARVDDLILRLSGEPESPQAIAGATCLYTEYDPVSGHCRVASAGHPPPAVIEPDGRARYIELEPGPPLGVGGMPFEFTDITLAPGSVLVLYSDGLVAGPDRDLDNGMRRLLDQIERFDVAHRDLDKAGHDLLDDVTAPRNDDTTLLLARVHRLPDEDSATWELPADPACVGPARDLATRQLAAWNLDELAFTTELVVSELVTNAVRYGGGGPITLRLIRGNVLVCEVSDPSNTQPRLRHARTTDEGGRGLFLIAQLTQRWGSRYQQSGKTIWAEQSLADEPALAR